MFEIQLWISALRAHRRTSNCEHIEPFFALEDANKDNNTNDTERDHRQFLGKFVHT